MIWGFEMVSKKAGVMDVTMDNDSASMRVSKKEKKKVLEKV